MKDKYPRYSQGQLAEIDKKLSPANKRILNEFCNHCLIKAGKQKVEKIRRELVQVHDITQTDFNKFNKEIVDSFLVVLNQSDRSIWTKNEIKVYLKKFLKWHYKDLDLIDNIRGENRRDLNPHKINENNLINEQDIEKMLRFAMNYKEKAYLFLAFESGARPQELLNLKWQDIKFEDNYTDITLYSNKTRQTRTFPVYKASKFLKEWKQNYSFIDVKESDYVFVSRWKEEHMTTVGLNKILRRMAQKAGLKKDVWNYLFRHSRATKLYEELPTPIVEKLMGHQNMSKVYAHISSKKAREEMLKKIYHVEELTQEQQNKYAEEITQIKGILKNLIGIENIYKFRDEHKRDSELFEKAFQKKYGNKSQKEQHELRKNDFVTMDILLEVHKSKK